MRWWLQATAVVLRRPSLWLTALVQVFRLARPGWWRHPPFLPLPDREYVRFRLETNYGDPEAVPTVSDLVTYLHWCREFPGG